MTDEITMRVENLENMLLHGVMSPLVKVTARQIRATVQIRATLIRTDTTAPYSKLDADGLLVVNDLAGNAAIRIENDPTDTISELRECEGGIAISSDQADYVTFRLYDTSFQASATQRRLNIEFTSATGRFEMADASDDTTFQILSTYSSGDVELKGLDSGDLILSSTSAQVTCTDDFEPTTDDTYYLGDYQKAWKGVIVADKSDSKYYLITTDAGAIDVTEVAS